MAKTIKFNLILDGYPVRNLEGLREHFSIEDMLDYYKNGLLVKWLEVRNYTEELEKVKKLEGLCKDGTEQNDARKEELVHRTAIELIKIFGMEIDDEQIEKDLAVINYISEKEIRLKEYEEKSFKEDQIISAYHTGYETLVHHMIDNKDSMPLLKADVLELEKSYLGLFKLDYHSLYLKLVVEAPKAIYAILTRPSLREFYLGENVPPQIVESLNEDIIPLEKIYENLQDDVTVVQRDTKGVWDQIEYGHVRIMVLHVAVNGAFVKSYQGDLDEKLGASEVNGKFLLLDGLEYTCNIEENELVYMEV